MEFEWIDIENFGTIGHIKLALNTPGLILITGDNRDTTKAESNGAGKSLLLDAICWCLWGDTVRGTSGDKVVRRQVGKDCCVKMCLNDDGKQYIVSRHRKDTRVDKPNDIRLFIDGKEKTHKMKEMQAVINQIIGFDFYTFCAMMPGAGIAAAALTDAKIKELLESLLHTEQLSDAYAEAREKSKELSTKLAAVKQAKKTAEASFASLQAEVAQIQTLKDSFEQNKADRIKVLRLQEEKINDRIEGYERQLYEWAHTRLNGDSLRMKILVLTKAVNALEDPEHPTRLMIKSLGQLQRDEEVQLLSAKRQMTELATRVAKLVKLEGNCPTCEQPVDAAHISSSKAVLDREIAALERAVEQSEDKIKALVAELTQLNQELQSFLRKDKDALTQAQNELRQEEKVVAECKATAAMCQREKQSLADVQAQIATAEAETHSFADIDESHKQRLETLLQELCQCDITIGELSKEEKLCNFWLTGFSPAGLRSYMLDYITPVLNDRMAYYSHILTDGEMRVKTTTKTGEKDKFQIIVEQKHGSDDYAGNSKGERARADLIIAMALGDLATFRSAKSLPWRFLDEAFENIDDAGNEAVLQLLNDQKSRYKTVFVITHKPAFKKLFTQRITVVKENGVSRLEDDSKAE